jgi:hypothetical protein
MLMEEAVRFEATHVADLPTVRDLSLLARVAMPRVIQETSDRQPVVSLLFLEFRFVQGGLLQSSRSTGSDRYHFNEPTYQY